MLYFYSFISGSEVLTCRRFLVSVQRQILTTEFVDFISVVSALLGSYYVFNMQYSSACVATLEYLQR